MSALYDFAPLAEADLPLVRRWLALPHVAEWWGDPDAAAEEVRQAIEEPQTEPYLVLIDGEPAGYVHAYDPHAEAGHPYQDQPTPTRGMDLFLAEERLLGQGHGRAFTRAFAERLLGEGAARVISDPHPRNTRAIATYLGAGFRPLGERNKAYGPVLLVGRDRDMDPVR